MVYGAGIVIDVEGNRYIVKHEETNQYFVEYFISEMRPRWSDHWSTAFLFLTEHAAQLVADRHKGIVHEVSGFISASDQPCRCARSRD